MSSAWIVWEILINAIESVFIAYLFSRRLNQVSYFRVLMGAGIVFCVICLNTFRGYSYYLSILFYVVACQFFSHWAYINSNSQKLFWGVFPVIISLVSDNITTNILDLLGADLVISLIPSTIRFQAVAMYIAICCPLYFLASTIWRKEDSIYLSAKIKIYIIILTILATFCLLTVDDITFLLGGLAVHEKYRWETIFISFVIILFLLSFIFLIAWIGIVSKKYMEQLLDSNRMKAELGNMKDAEASYETLRLQRHDITRHIEIMSLLLNEGKYNELSSYFKDYIDHLDTMPYLPLTDNPFLNACITVKANRAKILGINFNAVYSVTQDIPLGTTELCSLIGNMLDNAIEACTLVPTDPAIGLTITERNGMIMIRVENSANNVNTIEEGVTSKYNGDHGLGIKQMKNLVNKVKGFVHFEPLGDKVIVTAMLPFGEES